MGQKSRIHRAELIQIIQKNIRSPILYLAILCPPVEYFQTESCARRYSCFCFTAGHAVFKMFAQTYGQAKSELTHLYTSELVFAVIPDKIREASLCQHYAE